MLERGNSPCVSSMHPLNSSLHTIIHLYSFIYLLHKYLLCFQWARPCARHVKKKKITVVTRMQKWWSFLWLDCMFVGTYNILSYHFCVYLKIFMIKSIFRNRKEEKILPEIFLPRLQMIFLLLNIMNMALSLCPWQLSPQTAENMWQRKTSQRGRRNQQGKEQGAHAPVFLLVL